jgi:hypothetical protein
MTVDKIRDTENMVVDALVELVLRASKKDATPEEVEALPKVAEVLLKRV